MNIFDLPGPQFLLVFGILAVVSGIVTFWLRWALRPPNDEPTISGDALSPYEVAYLAGGAANVNQVALGRMVSAGWLKADATAIHAVKAPAPATAGMSSAATAHLPPRPDSLAPLEAALYEAAENPSGSTLRGIYAAGDKHIPPIRVRLESLGLVCTYGQLSQSRLIAAVPLVVLLLVGAIKIGVGVSRDRPVTFLVIMMIFAGVIHLALLGMSRHRTRRGDRMLERLKRDNSALWTQASYRAQGLAGDDLVLALGLFGVGIVTAGPIVDLNYLMRKQASANSGGCGTSGCGGGGGGCGGGCGGGGCGGCGG